VTQAEESSAAEAGKAVTMSADEVKEQLLWAAQEMLRTNLVEGTAGNLGARLPDGNAVLTPSSLDYTTMTLDDLVVCDLDGNVLEGHRSPTTEHALHLGALRMHSNIHATMHCHAKHCTMFALTRQPIPAVIEEFVVYVGGDVECADYRTTGTEELGEEVARRVADRAAVLMANHGLFAVGKDPKQVLHIAHLVERTAEIVWGARLLGEIVPVPDEVNQQFAGYYRFGRTGKF
jgi:L-fuculose-phosphate aldolase